MSSALRTIWETLWGLLVDDGQLAVGIVVALAITAFLVGIGNQLVDETAGWILLIMLVGLMVANLMRAGRNARRKRIST